MTESPYTVPSGRWQVEVSFVEYTRDEVGKARSTTTSVLPGAIKVGVSCRADVQLMVTPFLDLRRGGSPDSRTTGPGDLVGRFKLNLAGNDDGQIAFGVMPFVRIPLARQGLGAGRLEGGLIVPLAAGLPQGFDLGAMVELDLRGSASGTGYGVEAVHSITLGHSLAGERLGSYLEYAGSAPVGTGGGYEAYLDGGLTLATSSNRQLDAGLRLGLSPAADGFTAFVGFTFRR